MTHIFCLSALAMGFLCAAIPIREAQAQTLIIGRGGVHYSGYGQGYYGGYGRGYNGYSPRNGGYSGYGNGRYGAAVARPYPVNRGYGYPAGAYYNGYVTPGYYPQPYAPVY